MVPPHVLRALVLKEVEHQRPGLKAEFMDNTTSEGTLVLYSVVERDDFADWRWVYMQIKCEPECSYRMAALEAKESVQDWLEQYDKEVAEGPLPVEVHA